MFLLALAQPAHADSVAHPHFGDPDLLALRSYAQQIGGEQLPLVNLGDGQSPHPHFIDPELAALRRYAREIGIEQPVLAAAKTSGANPRPRFDDPEVAALHGFVQQGGLDLPQLGNAGEADTADPHADDPDVSALLRYAQLSGAAGKNPNGSPAPKAAAPKAPAPKTAAPRRDPAMHGNYVGAKTCAFCHASSIEVYNRTQMGRYDKAQPGKLDCENCHGPGASHVQAVGCAVCHGDGGVSTRRGMPSLVGLDPQYLVPAMKAYVSGQRKHELKKALMSGLGDAELNRIAAYYARQPGSRAQTPAVGDPAAGRGPSASCGGCHGAQGISTIPAWPSLAGQDAQYLADATRAYKNGSRSKVIACAACHGDRGVSARPGMPSLVGMDPQYLVPAMKAYVTGDRKHDLKKLLFAGLSDSELNNMAQFYARQTPAKAQTSATVGDPAAGKAAAASCGGCHGELGISANPAWPSLAGQDARYLADATKAYKDGSRTSELKKSIIAPLDDRTINDIAAYYASLRPAQAAVAQGTPGREPVLVRNGLVSFLDDRAINNVASYYASLRPGQPTGVRAPGGPEPAVVSKAAPVGGRSLGGIISFRRNDPGRSAEQNNQICLGCHERGARAMWAASTHETRGLACTDCHTVMKDVSRKAGLRTAFEPETCAQCHKNKRAEIWRTSHMPVREGKMTCSSCHNPHGSPNESLLKRATVNDTCYQCHAEKRGPFLWEHAPVRENCLNCHDPHGSVNDFMLKVSRPRSCQQCHGTVSGHPANPRNPQSVYALNRECQNCHSQVHGSNSPSGMRLMR